MPFGLKQTPQIFQRRMENILKTYSDYCSVYVDDILVFSDTIDQHMEHLELIIKALEKHGIPLSKKKV